MELDFIVIGAGSAGCTAAAGLAKANIGSVCVLEAGPTDTLPQVKIPFGLLYTMGSKRDWNFKSTPQIHADNRVFQKAAVYRQLFVMTIRPLSVTFRLTSPG